MIQIVLLVLGIIAMVRYPRLNKIAPADFPAVPAESVEQWRSAEKAAAIWLIVASVGVFILQLGVGFLLGFLMALSGSPAKQIDSVGSIFGFATLALFLVLLVIAAIAGSKASKLKKAAGIVWPIKHRPQ
ncbi:MAG: hypothetical protein WC718_10635 [Phycisphaerales bacterium]|jgi:hypothetical protein